MNRPSYKEINRKVKQAKEAVLEKRISFVKPVAFAVDALELGFAIEDIGNILIEILREITPNDYAGQYPLQRSYEDEIRECELFTFQWLSKKLGCRAYLKFTIKENQLWLVPLHQARTKREEE